MISCEKIQEMISSMLDGQLSDEERAAVEEHIARCPECAAMYEDFSALSISLKEEFSAVPAQLHDKISQRSSLPCARCGSCIGRWKRQKLR